MRKDISMQTKKNKEMKKVKIIRFADNEVGLQRGKSYFCEEVDMFALTDMAEKRKSEERKEFFIDEDTPVWSRNMSGCTEYIDYSKSDKTVFCDISFAEIKTDAKPPREGFKLYPLWVIKLRFESLYAYTEHVGYIHTEIILSDEILKTGYEFENEKNLDYIVY